MGDPRKRSAQENQMEMQRLRTMYDRLPNQKKAVHRDHLQKRMNDLQAAIDGKAAGSSMSTMQTALLVVLFGVLALGLGFFGVAYLAKG
jgi:hypothetical protein